MYYRQTGSFVEPGRNVRIADHPGVSRFSDSRTLDLLNERIALKSSIDAEFFV